MAIAERLSRYKEFATFLAKYGRAEFVTDPDATPQGSSSEDNARADEFARDVESLLGQTIRERGPMRRRRA